jgi:TPR repeat protein
VKLGLEYLHPHRTRPAAMLLIAESLTLPELAANGQEQTLYPASATSDVARLKLAAWLCVQGKTASAAALVESVADRRMYTDIGHLSDAGHPVQQPALFLLRLEQLGVVNAAEVALAAARRAIDSQDLQGASLAFAIRFGLGTEARDMSEHDALCDLLWLSENCGRAIEGVPAQHLRAALEHGGTQGEARAWFTLGRALCGLTAGPNEPGALVTRQNLRRGVALLLRAADAGHLEAWLHLHMLSSNGRSSVANPEMARFCLGKAAAAGFPEAQRRLGALMLRESGSLDSTEEALALLHAAATKGDGHAAVLLRSLLLPVAGSDEEVARAVERVREDDEALAASLEVAREFGLTRLEWCNLDFAECSRPWGLVTTQSRSLQPRLAAPRAIPAVSAAALDKLRTAAAMVSSSGGHAAEQRRHLLLKRGIAEDLFFADAKVEVRDRVRIGTRWAHHSSGMLRAALQ